mgnify:FL=1|tara:strand:- start:129 stop:332 length:204 start_codon:yes stop_codon:yes gene_type:complete
MAYYLVLKSVGNNFKNVGVYTAPSITAMKKRIQKQVDTGKKPRGEYVVLSNSALKNQQYYMKSKKKK